MPKVAMANTSECVAERSQGGGARPKVAMVAKPKAAGQSGSLYDVIIQHVWP